MVAYVRVVDGELRKGDDVVAMQTGTEAGVDELGFFGPDMTPVETLRAGEVGYLITGIKDVSLLRVGDTLTSKARPAAEPLPGYREVKPMVFCGLFPVDTDRFPELRDALEKLALNDAALSWEPETSQALGFGFRCGFLGLLHMDIVRERLEREYDLELLATTPTVEYEVTLTDGSEVLVHSPADMPDRGHHRGDPRARHPGHDPLPTRARGRRDGAVPGAPGRARGHELPLASSACRCATTCRWPRSCSTSSTSSSRAPRATPRSTTRCSACGPPTW